MGVTRRIVVTGAGGFVGSRLVTALLADPANADAAVTLVDAMPLTLADPRVRIVSGDLADAATIEAATGEGVDLVYHLASILGGAAEADPVRARRVNIDATLSLFERLRAFGNAPRVVFSSSIAVFGAPLPPAIDDATAPRPTMVYGAHKAMVETALAQYSARGWLDGLAVRLPGIVANAHADARMKAAFLNRIFYAYAAGEDMTMPVSPGGTTWLLSVPACIAALVHAGHVPANAIGTDRAITLPALRVTMGALTDALTRAYPGSASRIDFVPDPALDAQFASQPPLSTVAGDRMGFRHDGDIDRLVARAFG